MEKTNKQPEGYLSQDQAGVNSSYPTEIENPEIESAEILQTQEAILPVKDKVITDENNEPESYLSQDQAGVNNSNLPVGEDPGKVAENTADATEEIPAYEAESTNGPAKDNDFTDVKKTVDAYEERPFLEKDRIMNK